MINFREMMEEYQYSRIPIEKSDNTDNKQKMHYNGKILITIIIGVCIWNRCFFIKIYLYLKNKLNEFNNQSIGRYLWFFSIFLVTGESIPSTTARPLWLIIRWSNFRPLLKNWNAVLSVDAASIEISSNQKELSLVNTTREVARPI